MYIISVEFSNAARECYPFLVAVSVCLVLVSVWGVHAVCGMPCDQPIYATIAFLYTPAFRNSWLLLHD